MQKYSYITVVCISYRLPLLNTSWKRKCCLFLPILHFNSSAGKRDYTFISQHEKQITLLLVNKVFDMCTTNQAQLLFDFEVEHYIDHIVTFCPDAWGQDHTFVEVNIIIHTSS